MSTWSVAQQALFPPSLFQHQGIPPPRDQTGVAHLLRHREATGLSIFALMPRLPGGPAVSFLNSLPKRGDTEPSPHPCFLFSRRPRQGKQPSPGASLGNISGLPDAAEGAKAQGTEGRCPPPRVQCVAGSSHPARRRSRGCPGKDEPAAPGPNFVNKGPQGMKKEFRRPRHRWKVTEYYYYHCCYFVLTSGCARPTLLAQGAHLSSLPPFSQVRGPGPRSRRWNQPQLFHWTLVAHVLQCNVREAPQDPALRV